MFDNSLLTQLTEQAIHDGVQQFAVGAVVQKDNKVLILRRLPDDFMGGVYELPSGKVEADEPIDKALIREVKEETGLDVVSIRRYINSFDYMSRSGKKSRQFNFAVAVSNSDKIILEEHDLYEWVALTGEVPVTEAVKEVLKKFQEAASN
ncbi:NUDIX domain-containing protein [Baia soyae]|uniref:8-oxo-dGTP diphosphatase n=1 Tax=Baia soyae TaxID=1544746 RepID=A0A4R2S191_9BACL|nr:NUDIX domain-containing protein [Baia soyae]TCP66061.1 8-oxo-dGTP diphosphatase [Baia soyae]